MYGVKIIGNHNKKDLLFWHDLAEKEQEDIVASLPIERRSYFEEQYYFRYKGNIYCLCEFMAVPEQEVGWMKDFDGYLSDSFFSGILIKVDPGMEWLKVYSYVC